ALGRVTLDGDQPPPETGAGTRAHRPAHHDLAAGHAALGPWQRAAGLGPGPAPDFDRAAAHPEAHIPAGVAVDHQRAAGEPGPNAVQAGEVSDQANSLPRNGRHLEEISQPAPARSLDPDLLGFDPRCVQPAEGVPGYGTGVHPLRQRAAEGEGGLVAHRAGPSALMIWRRWKWCGPSL